jgi:hypothetical protein
MQPLDAEEQALVAQLHQLRRRKGSGYSYPATGYQSGKSRRYARGKTPFRTITMEDPSTNKVDVEMTARQRSLMYLSRRDTPPGKASSIRKLMRADRILNLPVET